MAAQPPFRAHVQAVLHDQPGVAGRVSGRARLDRLSAVQPPWQVTPPDAARRQSRSTPTSRASAPVPAAPTGSCRAPGRRHPGPGTDAAARTAPAPR
ncbi:hypothetical protein G6F31_021122 [Rhizopus arrhizus]|nr:hypothetical protein G6F31_021122 [Rhizopus arrhizus]